MAQTNSSLLATTLGTSINGYSGTSINVNCGTTISSNTTLNTFSSLTVQNMTPRQVNVAVFTITRDADTNEINSTKFVKELWIEQKNGTSIDLLVAKQLDKDFDPELTIIKTLSIVNF
jgi:hypothetical protein